MEWHDIVIRLGLSMLAGMLIGMERERNHRPAGVKTHILVCMGAALISLIQSEMMVYTTNLALQNPELINVVKTDYGRMGAQVVSGIGFLGAGTIIRTHGSVKGLTTAATLWMVACVGLAIGMGYYNMSIVAVLFVLLMLYTLKLLQGVIRNRVGQKFIEVKFIDKKITMKNINDYFMSKMIEIEQIEMIDASTDDEKDFGSKTVYTCSYNVLLPRHTNIKTVISDISLEENVFSVREGV